MNYLDFIEEYKTNKNINLFEKVLVVIKRAEDIYKGKKVTFANSNGYKPVDCAIYEINQETIKPEIRELTSQDYSEEIESYDFENKEELPEEINITMDENDSIEQEEKTEELDEK